MEVVGGSWRSGRLRSAAYCVRVPMPHSAIGSHGRLSDAEDGRCVAVLPLQEGFAQIPQVLCSKHMRPFRRHGGPVADDWKFQLDVSVSGVFCTACVLQKKTKGLPHSTTRLKKKRLPTSPQEKKEEEAKRKTPKPTKPLEAIGSPGALRCQCALEEDFFRLGNPKMCTSKNGWKEGTFQGSRLGT